MDSRSYFDCDCCLGLREVNLDIHLIYHRVCTQPYYFVVKLENCHCQSDTRHLILLLPVHSDEKNSILDGCIDCQSGRALSTFLPTRRETNTPIDNLSHFSRRQGFEVVVWRRTKDKSDDDKCRTMNEQPRDETKKQDSTGENENRRT